MYVSPEDAIRWLNRECAASQDLELRLWKNGDRKQARLERIAGGFAYALLKATMPDARKPWRPDK